MISGHDDAAVVSGGRRLSSKGETILQNHDSTFTPDEESPNCPACGRPWHCPMCGSARLVLAGPRRDWWADCQDCGAAIGGAR